MNPLGSAPKTRSQLGLGKDESPSLPGHPSCSRNILCICRPTNTECQGGIEVFGKILRTGQTSIGDIDHGCASDSKSLRILRGRREGGNFSLVGRGVQGMRHSGLGNKVRIGHSWDS